VAERADHPFELAEVNVQGDDDLERRYGIRVPVVEIDGEERFEYEVDPGELTRIIRGS
jgi:predicted thioredoxin/glutaredoxin